MIIIILFLIVIVGFVIYAIWKRVPRQTEHLSPTIETAFVRVLNTLKKNKVMVAIKQDGVYIRLAGDENKGEAFTKHWICAYHFDETIRNKSNLQNIK